MNNGALVSTTNSARGTGGGGLQSSVPFSAE